MSNSRILTARIYEDRGQHAKAIDQANLILQGDPRNPDGRLIKDRAMVGIGKGDEALPDLEQLVNEFPKFGMARLELATLYLSHRDYDKATAQYDQFSKDFPQDPRGLVGLQDVKMVEGKADEAIAGIKAILDKQPKDLQLRYQLAAFQAQAGMQASGKDANRAKQYFEDAANNYKEILKTTTNSADVWLRLGVMQRGLHQYDAALASFQQAATADPHNSAPILDEAMLLESLGKRKDAMAAYNKVLGIDPDNPLAMNNVAFLNAQDGQNLEQAKTLAEKAKQRFPNSPDISDTLGFVYYKKDLNAEALQIFKDLVASHGDNPTFHLHLAMALEKSGDKHGAREEAQKALQLSPPNQQAEIKSFLNQIG
jgi:tetratricopeptide (TPR) repeat protein